MIKNTLDGVKMVQHDELKNYDRIQEKIVSVMMTHGCKIVETPTFEDYDVYRNYFPYMRKQMIKTIDTDGRVLVLRPDVTVSLAKAVAKEFPDMAQLLKYGYVSTVFREYYGRSTYGKDFLQSGVEIFGDPNPECDGEIIVMAAEFLQSLGVTTMRIDIGTVAYTDELFKSLHLEDDVIQQVRQYIDERNLVDFYRYVKELALTERQQEVLSAIPTLFGSYQETLDRARSLCITDGMNRALDRLEGVYEYLVFARYDDMVQLDFGFTSRLGYYTDMIFKIYVDGALYSVVDGGRYDRLSEQFGVARPACGFGMNINLLYEFMNDVGLLGKAKPSFQLAIAYDVADKNLVRDLMDWRIGGYRVTAYGQDNLIDQGDYLICATYAEGAYRVKGKICSKRELKELMRRR